jgi:hypothetical protein
MAYDFDLVRTLSGGFEAKLATNGADTLEIDFGQDVVLCFVNASDDQDSLVGFKGTPWHSHGSIGFSDPNGNWIELDYGEVLIGLTDGSILVCERWTDGHIHDRWLIHSKYFDELNHMRAGDEIRVKRIAVRA